MPRIRLLSLVVLVLLTASAATAQESTPSKSEKVRFEGQTLILAASNASATERVREFIPEGEKLSRWTRLAALREYPKLSEPQDVAQEVLRALKEKSPQAQSAIIRNPKTGEVIIDFLLPSPDGAFWEFNLFKYSKLPTGGLASQQYALRVYGDPKPFLIELKTRRKALVEAMAKGGLEIVK